LSINWPHIERSPDFGYQANELGLLEIFAAAARDFELVYQFLAELCQTEKSNLPPHWLFRWSSPWAFGHRRNLDFAIFEITIYSESNDGK